MRLLDRALTALCIAVVIVAAATAGSRLVDFQAYVVRGGSMAPHIPQGSLVFVRAVPARDLRVGDVISYRRPQDPDHLVTHRIVATRSVDAVGTNGQLVRTRGDANDVDDPWEVQLLGTAWRVTVSVPLAGTLLDALATPAGRAAALVVPAAALLALAAVRAKRVWDHRQRPAPEPA